MAGEKKIYAYRLIKAKCSCGSKDFSQYINLPKDHGVYLWDEETPVLNANDHVANEHIFTFGRCTGPNNTKADIASVATTVLTSAIPVFGPIGGMVLGSLQREFVGVPCEPLTVVPWIFVDEDNIIDGAPALTIQSQLPCYRGGTITICYEKDDEATKQANQADDEDTQEEEIIERHPYEYLPSEVQENIQDFCNGEPNVNEGWGTAATQAVLSEAHKIGAEQSNISTNTGESTYTMPTAGVTTVLTQMEQEAICEAQKEDIDIQFDEDYIQQIINCGE